MTNPPRNFAVEVLEGLAVAMHQLPRDTLLETAGSDIYG